MLTSGLPQEEEKDQFMRTGGTTCPQQSCQEKQTAAQPALALPFPSKLHHQIMFIGDGGKPSDRTQLVLPVLEGETFPSRPNERKASLQWGSQPNVGWTDTTRVRLLNDR